MITTHLNPIAGQWVACESTIEIPNLSDLSDVGGRGDGSYGPREQGSYAAEFYTTVKTAYISSGTPL